MKSPIEITIEVSGLKDPLHQRPIVSRPGVIWSLWRAEVWIGIPKAKQSLPFLYTLKQLFCQVNQEAKLESEPHPNSPTHPNMRHIGSFGTIVGPPLTGELGNFTIKSSKIIPTTSQDIESLLKTHCFSSLHNVHTCGYSMIFAQWRPSSCRFEPSPWPWPSDSLWPPASLACCRLSAPWRDIEMDEVIYQWGM